MSGGRRRDPKPTADITRSSGVWVVFGSVRSVEKVAKSCKRRQNLQKIRRNLQKPSRSTPKITEFSLDLLESHQIWSRSRLDLLECRRISPNLAWISSNVAGSHQISLGSSRILPDLYITSVESGGSGFGEENPPLDSPASGLGCGNPLPTIGVVGSGGFRFKFKQVARVGQVPGWLDTPDNHSCSVGV